MIFTERIEKLLGANHIKEVIDEFLKFLGEVPQSNREARADANQLRGQIIVLSGRFTELNTKVNTNTIDQASANQEKSMIINSFIQILNQLPSNHPDLYRYLDEKNEDDEWKDAQNKNKIEAYQVYFSKYPNGKYKEATIKLIGELEEVKRKQDEEIKRLAMLEKERRENDKAAAVEAQRARQTAARQTTYKTAAPVTAAPAKSNKLLYIILGAVAGIVLLIVVANLVVPDEKPAYNPPAGGGTITKDTTSSYTPEVIPASATAVLTEAIKAELISAIRLANNAEINAYSTLNPNALYNSYTGEALKQGLANIEQLKTNGLLLAPTMEKQEFRSFKLSEDGTEANVRSVETWSGIYYWVSTNTCFGKVPSHKVPQTVYLRKSEDGWIVTSIVHDNPNAPETLPCD
jgi:hypothetical protein